MHRFVKLTPGNVLTINGSTASGKTLLCTKLANTISDKVLYIDTCGDLTIQALLNRGLNHNPNFVLNNFVGDTTALESTVNAAIDEGYKLIIVDTVPTGYVYPNIKDTDVSAVVVYQTERQKPYTGADWLEISHDELTVFIKKPLGPLYFKN